MSAPSSTPQALALADLTSELLSIFECPVCLDTIMPPILLCMNGHLLCSTCGKDIAACPLCRANISNVRALAMEKVAERLPYPCKYSEYGCPTQPLLIAKPDHEKTCAFRLGLLIDMLPLLGDG
ncbi:hypothetical protein HPB49_000496 [Dermacentor silvarum]|uniref:Uncharacterized protein n=1 Tax=Dermacentor silvarum TaxID=543639 RepID=A0ACB8DHN2_DERSI|nr:hypothetical protein HPB49_000496 [Dermacentor silvarum]